MQVVAEMVALVHSLEATIGDQVEPGDTLLILESMKMEIPVLAEGAGTVIEFAVVVGDVVNEGDLLVILQ
jgi:acetyl-CoA carboxylase biotin carboxyl carrier protein